jgi:hypothetical protein
MGQPLKYESEIYEPLYILGIVGERGCIPILPCAYQKMNGRNLAA